MHKAALYQRANGVQRRDAKQVLDEFGGLLQWRPNGGDSVLDIGCGSGDVTLDYVFPLMPINFKRLCGVDISEQMIRHAMANALQPNVDFVQMDIEKGGVSKQLEPFDHVVSFYCLHWVQNQRQVLKNIYELLTPNGDCLLVFLAKNPIFEIYKGLSQNNKWAPYMKDVNRFISPYQYSKDPQAEFFNLMISAGFVDCQIEARDKIFVFEGIDLLKKSVRAVSPFIDRIPLELQEDFLNDYIDSAMEMGLFDFKHNQGTSRFVTPYTLIIAYARKYDLLLQN